MNDRRAANIPLGIGLMLLGTFIFSVNDVIGKWLAGTYSVGQILLFRSIVALVILIPVMLRLRAAPIRLSDRPWLQLLRTVFAVAEVSCFYLAVAALPLASTKTFYLASPIYVTLLAAMILREYVGWRRWSAVLVGFAGVLITLQPALGSSLGWPALIAFSGSAFYALLMIVTRSLRGTPDISMISAQIIGCLIFGIAAAPFAWVPMSGTDMVITGLVGLLSMCGWLCISRSLKHAPASALAPYQYTTIVWAVIFGYLFFAEVPLAATLIGAAIIIAAGSFIFFRERRLKVRSQAAAVAGPEGLPASGSSPPV